MRNDRLRIAVKKKDRLTVPTFSGGADFFSDESVTSFSHAADCWNFDFSDGALRPGWGLKPFDGFGELKLRYIWQYTRYDPERSVRDDRLLAVDEGGGLYERRAGGAVRLGDVTFSDTPVFINYRLYGDDVALICSETDGMFVYNGKDDPYRVEGAPAITSLALHYERLFVTVGGEKNAVWFSDDLDPTNWDASLSGGGFIQLVDERGASDRVISFLGYVYVFRDHGISRITAFGSQAEFSVSNLFVAGGRIYPGSVCVCGDAVIFLAEDGLYAFDGVSASKILPALDGLFTGGDDCCSFFSGGKYYLAFRRDEAGGKIGCEKGEYKNNALLRLDVSRGAYSVSRGFDAVAIARTDDGVVAITSDGRAGLIERCGEAFGEPLPKRWRVPRTDLGTPDLKRVSEVSMATATPASVTLRSDEGEKRLEFPGRPGITKKRVSFSGRRIGFDVEVDCADAKISRPSITVVASAR